MELLKSVARQLICEEIEQCFKVLRNLYPWMDMYSLLQWAHDVHTSDNNSLHDSDGCTVMSRAQLKAWATLNLRVIWHCCILLIGNEPYARATLNHNVGSIFCKWCVQQGIQPPADRSTWVAIWQQYHRQ